MGAVKLIGVVLLMCSLCTGLSVSFVAFAQAQSAMDDSIVDLTPGLILGTVTDPWGYPVSNATVTLWLYGQPWEQSGFKWDASRNPQASAFYQYGAGAPEGSYAFGFVQPGLYLLTAEKDGYTNSRVINLGESSPHESVDGKVIPVERVNISLGVYPNTFYLKRDSLNCGSIAGLINDSGGLASRVNVSLLRNGTLVAMVRNPQLSSDQMIPGYGGNYLFEHLAPGQYRIVIETVDASGAVYKAYKAEYVDNDIRFVSFELPFKVLPDQVTPAPSLVPAPTESPVTPAVAAPSPAVTPSQEPAATPAPSPGILVLLTALGAASILILRKRQ